MTSAILTALRRETTEAHHALEAQIDFMTPSLTLEKYLQTLRVFEAFVSCWEEQTATHCPSHLTGFWQERRRAWLLKNDLEYFSTTRIDAKPLLPAIDAPSAFFGSLYVMEGSTLGGQVIARELEIRLGLSGGSGYSYFRGRGSETGRMWKEFLELLAQESASLHEQSVTAAAQATFEAFRCFHAQQI